MSHLPWTIESKKNKEDRFNHNHVIKFQDNRILSNVPDCSDTLANEDNSFRNHIR